MVVLVAADDAALREDLATLLRDRGYRVNAASLDEIAVEVARRPPYVLVIAENDGATLRRTILRARSLSQRPLAVLAVVPPSSHWLRTGVPADLLPAGAVGAEDIDTPALDEVLGALQPHAVSESRDTSLGFDPERRIAIGPRDSVQLTISEATLLGLIMEAQGAVVPSERVAEGLWGAPRLDRRARGAMRTQLYALRRKLRAIGLGDVIESLPGVGYRLRVPEAE